MHAATEENNRRGKNLKTAHEWQTQKIFVNNLRDFRFLDINELIK